MKKIFYISGSLAVVLIILSLFGAINFSDSKRDTALAEGNRLLESGKCKEAAEAYGKGLKEYPEDPELNYNSGQALYSMGEYSLAKDYYEKSVISKPERYLNMGNCSLKQNDYKQALECYRQGILEFPQDVPLKYNYEYVQEKISQVEQSKQGGEDEQQSGESEQQQGGEGEQQQQSGESEQQQGGEGEQQQSGEGGQQGGEVTNDDSIEQKQARIVIENTLKALEKQEADSLKNNQKHSYKEGEYEW